MTCDEADKATPDELRAHLAEAHALKLNRTRSLESLLREHALERVAPKPVAVAPSRRVQPEAAAPAAPAPAARVADEDAIVRAFGLEV